MANNEQDSDKDRSTFLIAMYNQLMGDINRHIVVVWQSVSILLGAFAAWSLVEKKIISLDVAITLMILLACWVLAHVYDAAYWYNRNLVIIANIERQFLRTSDLREIHYYFGEHRDKASMLTHLRLQLALALGIGGLAVAIHLFQVILPAIQACAVNIQNGLPYVALLIAACVWLWSRKRAQTRYAEFIQNSPGKKIDTSGIEYGVGHPVQRDERTR